MATADFTIADVLAWARTKPAGDEYCYTSNGHCAIARFLKDTGRSRCPEVMPEMWWHGEGVWYDFPALLESALTNENGNALEETFGALASRLEALLHAEPLSDTWTNLAAYLTDIEAVESVQA